MQRKRPLAVPSARSGAISRQALLEQRENGQQVSLLLRKLQCFSVACNDIPQLEFGDKVVLPPKVLQELQCFKIPTPWLFQIRVFAQEGESKNGSDATTTALAQHCSVQEFSAPEGQIFLPYWMMQNLGADEGGFILITNTHDIPRGIYCRLQPEDAEFLTLAAEIGPKLLMENAMRRYSVLSVNETIVIEYGVNKYFVRVLELKPGSVVSLCGDVNLEMDFSVPEVLNFDAEQSDLRRPKSAATVRVPAPQIPAPDEAIARANVSGTEALGTSSAVSNASNTMSGGRRLRDGGYVVKSEDEKQNDKDTSAPATSIMPAKTLKIQSSALQVAQRRLLHSQQSQQSPHQHPGNQISISAVALLADSTSMAKTILHAQAPFTTQGHVLGVRKRSKALKCSVLGPEEDHKAAETTDNKGAESQAPPSTQQSTTASALTCSLCLAEVTALNMEMHTLRCAKNPAYHKVECSTCHEIIIRSQQNQHLHCLLCPSILTSDALLEEHMEELHAKSQKCDFCGGFFTPEQLADHVQTEYLHALKPCIICGFTFKRKDIDVHVRMCSSRTERCDVCQKFVKVTDMERHVNVCGDISVHFPEEEPSAIPQSTAALLECVYCSKSGFKSEAELSKHVNIACRIARSFLSSFMLPKDRSSSRGSNQDSSSSASTSSSNSVQAFVQRRIRRKGDVSALHKATASLLDELNKKYDNNNNNADDGIADIVPRAVKHSSNAGSTNSLRAASVPVKAKAVPQQLDPLVHRANTTYSTSKSSTSKGAPSASITNSAARHNANDAALSITSMSVSLNGKQQQQRPNVATAAARGRKTSPSVPRKLDKLL